MKTLEVGGHLDQYLLTDVLARTVTATVFKAHDTEAGRFVCVKVPHLRYESDLVFYERFTREAKLLGRLRHPNIVRALEPQIRSRLYLVTELVAGQSLRSSLATGPMPVEQASHIALQLCAALAYIHGQGVIHRDIKPENILLTQDGSVKLIDFGIARDHSEHRITWGGQSKTMMGTPDYLSPEQLRGRRGDARSDIYAAGLVLYEMLTGNLPYSGDNFFAIMRSKISDEPIPPTYFRPEIDPNLSAIVCKAIARTPRDRHSSAAELLSCLRNPGAAVDVDGREVGASTKIRHHVVPEVSLLDRVVHAPVAPHTRHIMVRHVAMEEEVTGQLLAETRATLRLEIEGF